MTTVNVSNYIVYHPNDATNVVMEKTIYHLQIIILLMWIHTGKILAKRLGTATIEITVYDDNDTTIQS